MKLNEDGKRCPICRLNKKFCFCHTIKDIHTKTKISMIIHVRELKLTTNTAQLAHKVLPNSELLVRGRVGDPIDLNNLIDPDHIPLYLFPDEDAVELDQEFIHSLDRPVQLIVPDGSWRQAKKFKKREKVLQGIQSVRLTSTRPSDYILRKEPNEHSLCTYEAIARALGELEGPQVLEELETIFHTMIEKVMESRKGYVEEAPRYREYLLNKKSSS